jgi:hypothetical protein
MMRNFHFLLMLLLMFIFVGSVDSLVNAETQNSQVLQIVEGDNWWLPPTVQKTPNSGTYDYLTTGTDANTLIMTWKEINPREGVYDWTKLETALATGKPIWLRIYVSDRIHCPDWLRKKYKDLPTYQYIGEDKITGLYPDLITGISRGRFHPLWHHGLEGEFKKVLLSFKQHHFAAKPNLIFMYAPGAWRWNEWEMVFVNEIKKSGVTPDQFLAWFKRHIDDYVDAFEGKAYKLVFTGPAGMERCSEQIDWILKINDVNKGLNNLTDYAIAKGMSVRVGAMEYFNNYSNLPSWGAPAITIGKYNYQTIDENHPLHSDPKRIIGTENEGFNNKNMIKDTPEAYYPRMDTLKALQMRVNWLNTSDDAYTKTKDIHEYAKKVMGKHVKDSPDAFVVLRQFYDPMYLNDPAPPAEYTGLAKFLQNAKLPYRNWERWLIQREVAPDGLTIATEQPKVPANNFFMKWNGVAYEAIRTDHVNKSDYIYFGIDDRFMKAGSNKVLINVTYLDNNTANWCIEYDSSNQVYQQTPNIKNTKSGKWKTATFAINNAAFMNRQNGKMDFRIYNGGQEDFTVELVRVVKVG